MTNILELAREKFERKMSLPQYSEYLDNEDAQLLLMQDCIREARFEAAMDSRKESGLLNE